MEEDISLQSCFKQLCITGSFKEKIYTIHNMIHTTLCMFDQCDGILFYISFIYLNLASKFSFFLSSRFSCEFKLDFNWLWYVNLWEASYTVYKEKNSWKIMWATHCLQIFIILFIVSKYKYVTLSNTLFYRLTFLLEIIKATKQQSYGPLKYVLQKQTYSRRWNKAPGRMFLDFNVSTLYSLFIEFLLNRPHWADTVIGSLCHLILHMFWSKTGIVVILRFFGGNLGIFKEMQ